MNYIILDIEGTTTDINFVHNVLFPYAKSHMQAFINEQNDDPVIRPIIEDIQTNYLDGDKGIEAVIAKLQEWMDNDNKITPLKKLQGHLWEKGYQVGDFKAHLYPEVYPTLVAWKEKGLKLFIYSSGSVKAQKLLFGHTEEGDINSLFSGYFDTEVGGKKESTSYEAILKNIKANGNDVCFLSDNEDELDAAKEVGITTFHVDRENQIQNSKHKIIKTFQEVQIG